MSKRSKREAAVLAELEEKHEPSLTVVVDFNGLLDMVGDVKAWEMLGTLKDLLG